MMTENNVLQPNEADMELTVEQAQEFLKNYIEKTGKTQSAVAQELGISSGGLSSFLSGNYKTPHKIVPKVKNLMEISEKKKITLTDPPFVETTVSKMVKNAIKYSHVRGKISVVYGDAGIGKTQAFRSYLRENGLAVGITIAPTYASITGVNELLAEQLGVRERYARKVYNEIINRLSGSGRVIIIDEAQNFYKDELKKVLTRVHDTCKVIVIGHTGQIDLYHHPENSGFAPYIKHFEDIDWAQICHLTNNYRGKISNHADSLSNIQQEAA